MRYPVKAVNVYQYICTSNVKKWHAVICVDAVTAIDYAKWTFVYFIGQPIECLTKKANPPTAIEP